MHSAPLKTRSGSWAKSDKEKADTFADQLAEIFQPNNSEAVVLTEEPGNIAFPSFPVVKRKELKKAINNLFVKKAPGFDLITPEILKNLPNKALKFLTRIMNAVFKLKCVPTKWKVAEIIMILKPGKTPNDPKSYRPISLLPMISKIFERLLLNRLEPLIKSSSVIPNHQFGFRKGHSTIDQIHRITNEIENALETKQICSAVFLDVAQAFDKVWHEGLLYKLSHIVPTAYVDLFKSYLTNRSFYVKNKAEVSLLREIKAGVPQASILGPILYVLYTYDIPQIDNAITATFAAVTASLIVHDNIKDATQKRQQVIDHASSCQDRSNSIS